MQWVEMMELVTQWGADVVRRDAQKKIDHNETASADIWNEYGLIDVTQCLQEQLSSLTFFFDT